MNSERFFEELTIEERLEVAIMYYDQFDPHFAAGLRYARILIKTDGWMSLAPAWIKEWKRVFQEVQE